MILDFIFLNLAFLSFIVTANMQFSQVMGTSGNYNWNVDEMDIRTMYLVTILISITSVIVSNYPPVALFVLSIFFFLFYVYHRLITHKVLYCWNGITSFLFFFVFAVVELIA